VLQDFKAFKLSVEFHILCKSLVVSYYLRDQLLRASSSISLNLAEGSGKFGEKDQRRFFGHALGSLREVQAILILEGLESSEIAKKADQLGGYIYKLIKSKPSEN
jgi:four helix bundle protein